MHTNAQRHPRVIARLSLFHSRESTQSATDHKGKLPFSFMATGASQLQAPVSKVVIAPIDISGGEMGKWGK